MIPLLLQLRNFMCYRDNVPPLSFAGMKLVCLCGDNGNGKSALLDAMTWALWGKARGRTTDELVHAGQTDMEVDFEFAVGDQPYRVVRKHARSRVSRPGYGSLDFQIKNNDSFASLSGATIHETEGNIRKVLRTDYDTFINSAYLVQGRADEFTQKRPSERKEILADILGLSLYDSYEETAKDARKDREAGRKALDLEIESKSKKLEEMDSCRAGFAQAESQLADLGGKIAQAEEGIALLERRKGELEVKKGQAGELEKSLKDLELELVKAGGEIKAHAEKVKSFEKALEQEAEVERGYAGWQKLTRENEEWNEKLRAWSALSTEINQIEKRVEKVKSDLFAERNSLSKDIADLEKIAAELPRLQESQKQLQSAAESLAQQSEALDRKRQQAAEAESDIKTLTSANTVLEKEIKDLREKLEMLRQETAKCPLCDADLGADGKSRLDAGYQQQIKEKAEDHRTNLEEVQRQRKSQQALRSEVAAGDLKLKADSVLKQKELAGVAGRTQRAGDARNEVVGKMERKSALDAVLASGDFAAAEQKSLAELRAKYREVGYDQGQHSAVREKLKESARYEALKRAVEEARANLSHEKALLLKTEGMVTEKTAAREEKSQLRAFLEKELVELPGVSGNWRKAKDDMAGLLREKEAAGKRSGELKGKLDYLKQLQREKQKGEIERTRLAEEEKIYADLALYFGKKGIQAMLIETAIPEIEEEANLLLGRLTENRLTLKIETQRAKRTGAGTDETLDIKIADELGTRDYALFSGGEAFRINFALRLALSRLLARRAGAPLPTLIIDEGFGTQDREGRERLVEAIGSIKDDFEKIIVITHIEELKEAFPVRIEVTKGPEGSTFTVV